MKFFFDHIGIVVKDLAESVPFYEAIVGPPVERVSWRGKDAEYVAKMVAHPGLELDAVFFQVPYSQTLIEMIQYRGVPPTSSIVPPMQVSAMHIGLYVDDLDATVASLGKLGVTFRSEPVDIPYGPYKGGRTIYFSDPNGVNLQLMQVVGRPGRVELPAGARGATA